MVYGSATHNKIITELRFNSCLVVTGTKPTTGSSSDGQDHWVVVKQIQMNTEIDTTEEVRRRKRQVEEK